MARPTRIAIEASVFHLKGDLENCAAASEWREAISNQSGCAVDVGEVGSEA